MPGEHDVSVTIEPGLAVAGTLEVPSGALGMVLIPHASASARKAARQRMLAAVFQRVGLATLSLDLLSPEEERADKLSHRLRFDIPLLAGRTLLATSWVSRQPALGHLPIGYCGENTTGAGVLVAAAHESDRVRAVVALAGRADLAGRDLAEVRAPTLLIVGGSDVPILAVTRSVQRKLAWRSELAVIPGATHLFEQSGAFELAAFRARDFFLRQLGPSTASTLPMRSGRAPTGYELETGTRRP